MFDTAEEFLLEAIDYFQWVDTHPMREEVPFHYKGGVLRHSQPRMRPYTLQGLATFLGVDYLTLRAYRDHPILGEAMRMCDQIIYTQKFEGAAANMLNANIISRELGLADRQEHTGPNGGPITMISSDMTPQEAAAAYAATLQGDEG